MLNTLIQLHQNTSGADNLSVHLNAIADEVSKPLDVSQQFLDAFNQRCQNGRDAIGSYVSAWSQKVNEMLPQMQSLNDDTYPDVVARLAKYKAEIGPLRENLKNLNDKVKNALKTFSDHGSAAEDKRKVIKTLINIIEDEILAAPEAPAQALVQKFQTHFSQLKEQLAKSDHSVYGTMLTNLVELATQRGMADQAVVAELIDALNNLDQEIEDFRVKQESTDKEQIKLDRSLADAQQDAIRTNVHQTVVLEKKKKSIEGTLEDWRALLDDRDAKVKQFEGELAAWNDYCSNVNNKVNELSEYAQRTKDGVEEVRKTVE